MRIHAERPSLVPLHAADAQPGIPVERFALRQQPQILARDLDRLFRKPGVLVAEQFDLRPVPRRVLPLGASHVQTALAILRHRQKQVEHFLIRVEAIRQLPVRRGRIRIGDLEQQTVRKNTRAARDLENAAVQVLLADLQGAETPGPERQVFQMELQKILEEAILQLQMLRVQESSFGPDYRLELPHIRTTVESTYHMPRRTRSSTVLLPNPHRGGRRILSSMAAAPASPSPW